MSQVNEDKTSDVQGSSVGGEAPTVEVGEAEEKDWRVWTVHRSGVSGYFILDSYKNIVAKDIKTIETAQCIVDAVRSYVPATITEPS